ncbi:MAG TPA: hypothetical protein VHT53_09350, partial [Candidatus Elarobacter sp.]|nr:hypothetical protein [Candidatus Elarobacter sp.]
MRILLVRLDGVGDAAVCVPLIAALRAAGHEVGAAMSSRNAGLFASSALVAEHVLERIPWPAHGSTPESTARAKAQIASMWYDAALVASEEPEAFALAARIPQRVGFTTGFARPLKTLWVRARTTRTVSRSQRIGGEPAHEVEVMYRLGEGFVREPRPPEDRAALRPVLLDAPVAPQLGSVVVQAGTKWFASGVSREAVRRLHERLAPRARVVCAPAEAGAVLEATGIEPETPRSMRAWVETLASAETVVTVDT